MNFSFVVLKSVSAKKSFTNTSLTPVLKTFKIIIDFNTFNLEYTENFVLMVLKHMLGYKLVDTVHPSG